MGNGFPPAQSGYLNGTNSDRCRHRPAALKSRGTKPAARGTSSQTPPHRIDKIARSSLDTITLLIVVLRHVSFLHLPLSLISYGSVILLESCFEVRNKNPARFGQFQGVRLRHGSHVLMSSQGKYLHKLRVSQACLIRSSHPQIASNTVHDPRCSCEVHAISPGLKIEVCWACTSTETGFSTDGSLVQHAVPVVLLQHPRTPFLTVHLSVFL
jgi:hypothetical protein